ncbi:LysE family translocator [Streptomyces sp. LP05-1]|uniref:LysE family translocator n=1 Tax=Streptomyces pyxinae TaxID=2970734 RepID=A0ABT2CHM4_9ACTN|nr:LysE family translocator [Streptomyces sp. LP05-1]MCS0636912.1 LysE family translocator [Streptomyces sp. LP05-1]
MVIVTPGPDLALITNMVLTRSVRTATVAALGMITAGAGQIALGVAGLTALLATSPVTYAAFRWTGAVILLVWAVLALRRVLRSRGGRGDAPSGASVDAVPERGAEEQAGAPPPGPTEGADLSPRRAFAQGLMCTGANPKVGIFLMAFLPQFVPRGVAPEIGVPVLAVCYLALGLLWLLVWIRAVHRLLRYVRSPRMLAIFDGLTALIFGAFSMRLALGA